MGRARGADDEEPVLELSALERLFEGEADPTLPRPDDDAPQVPSQSPGSGASDA